MATDIGNTYKDTKTKEKVYIVAVSDLGDKEGHTMIIHKALYGSKSSGLRWYERLADCLKDMGFSPCREEPDIWMREKDSLYEYIAVYIDDLAIAARDSKEITDTLMDRHKFKLKGTEPIKYHLE